MDPASTLAPKDKSLARSSKTGTGRSGTMSLPGFDFWCPALHLAASSSFPGGEAAFFRILRAAFSVQ
jgi:hypothetical protein